MSLAGGQFYRNNFAIAVQNFIQSDQITGAFNSCSKHRRHLLVGKGTRPKRQLRGKTITKTGTDHSTKAKAPPDSIEVPVA